MFGIIQQLGPMEIGIVVGLIIFLFGAKRIPELARGIGQAVRELRDGVKGVEEMDDNPKS